MCGAYWYMSCEVLSEAAAIIAEDFQKVIHLYKRLYGLFLSLIFFLITYHIIENDSKFLLKKSKNSVQLKSLSPLVTECR